MVPVTNLRRYGVSYADALKDQRALTDALAKAGMTLDEVHYEVQRPRLGTRAR